MSLGPSEILVVALVALVVLGPDKLPQAARRAGKLIGELKKLSADVKSQVDGVLDLNEEEAQPSPASPPPSHPDTKGFRLVDGESPDESPQ